MRAAWPLAGVLLLTLSVGGCLGVDNMGELKQSLGYGPAALVIEPPVARARASLTLVGAGQPVAFSAQGSLDPQGLPLSFAWDFGDGTAAEGSEATHRFTRAGIYTVTLTARNLAGAEGLDTLLVTVRANAPPEAVVQVLKAGAPAERAWAGEELEFRATARDPEGEPVTLRWDFGDGATGLGAAARHTFARGGLYVVALHAEDPSGLAALVEREVPVDQLVSFAGNVGLLGEDQARHALDVAGARTVRARLAFDPMLGLHALDLVLLDAANREVARAGAAPPPGTQGVAEALLEAGGAALEGRPGGAWTLVVERRGGVEVDYRLTAEVLY